MFTRGRDRAEAVQDALSARVATARNWAEEHPAQCVAIGLGLLVVSAGLIYLAITGKQTILGLVGMFVAVAGLKFVNVRIQLDMVHPWRWFALGVVGVAAGCLMIGAGLSGTSAPTTAVGVLVVLLGLLPVTGLFRRLSESSGDGASDAAGPWWLVPGGLVAMVVGVVASRWLGLGIVLPLAGLVLYKLGLRRARGTPRWAWLETVVGGAATVLGLVGMVVATWADNALLGAAAAALFVLGLIALSSGWPSDTLRLRPFTRVAAIGTGLVVLVAGTLVAREALDLVPGATIVYALVVGALGASFVWRGEALFVGVLVGSALVWLSVDRVDEARALHPQSDQRILALGDSYISGEGAPHFLEGTNVNDENQCRRSVTAYPYLVAENLGMGLDFYACSGAKAKELYDVGQQPKSPADVAGALPQLQNPIDISKISVVLVSIGGNDAQFGDIVQGCVIPGTCDSLSDLWLTNLDQVGDDITTALVKIKERVPNVPVVVVPYPLMLEDHSCSWSRLDKREHEFISQFIVTLDDRVRVAARKAGVHFFEEGMFAFQGARICGGPPERTVTNFININPIEGSLGERINPRNWIHGSFHPKPTGHKLMADLLTTWLRSNLSTPNPQPEPNATFAYPNLGGTTRVLVAEADRAIDPACGAAPGQRIEPFGTKVRLYEKDLAFPVPAAPGSPVCVWSTNGSWASIQPTETDRSAGAYLDGGVVFVKPPPEDEPEEQRVVFVGTDGRMQLRFVTFCVTSGCPDSFDHYFKDQVGIAVDVVVPPLLLTIVGGWLFAAGTTVRRRREVLAEAARARSAAVPPAPPPG